MNAFFAKNSTVKKNNFSMSCKPGRVFPFFGERLYSENKDNQTQICTQVLHLNLWIRSIWKDSYLVWNPKDFNNITNLVLPPTSVWLPDFGVWNSRGNVYNKQHYNIHKVMVFSDGKVVCCTHFLWNSRLQSLEARQMLEEEQGL